MVGNERLEGRDEIVQHILNYFSSLYSNENWNRPALDNLEFARFETEEAQWLERRFQEEEVRAAILQDIKPWSRWLSYGLLPALLD